MKIALLASNPNLYSNKRIIEAAKKRGHEAEFINIGDCYIKVSENDPAIFHEDGVKIEGFDYVIPRIRPNLTFYGVAMVRQFEVMGIKCLNGSQAITHSRDKLHTLQILSQNKLSVPTTSFANSSYETKDLIKLVEGAPLVIKLLEGTKGIGVVLAETSKAAESVINAFRSLKADILVQHYVKESKGQDLRCFVVGDKVVASMERIAQEGEFRANIHLGATARAIEVTKEEKELAIKAAQIVGLDVAGIDMVRSGNGPQILEINSSPGLEGIEGSTGVDVASKMIELLEEKQK